MADPGSCVQILIQFPEKSEIMDLVSVRPAYMGDQAVIEYMIDQQSLRNRNQQDNFPGIVVVWSGTALEENHPIFLVEGDSFLAKQGFDLLANILFTSLGRNQLEA